MYSFNTPLLKVELQNKDSQTQRAVSNKTPAK